MSKPFEIIQNRDGILRLIHEGRVVHITAKRGGNICVEVWGEDASHDDPPSLHAIYHARPKKRTEYAAIWSEIFGEAKRAM